MQFPPTMHYKVERSLFLMSALPVLTPSRAHSPGLAAPTFTGAARFNTSFYGSSPKAQHGLLPSPNNTINETMVVPEMKPIVPDLCMEQLWSETGTASCSK